MASHWKQQCQMKEQTVAAACFKCMGGRVETFSVAAVALLCEGL